MCEFDKNDEIDSSNFCFIFLILLGISLYKLERYIFKLLAPAINLYGRFSMSSKAILESKIDFKSSKTKKSFKSDIFKFIKSLKFNIRSFNFSNKSYASLFEDFDKIINLLKVLLRFVAICLYERPFVKFPML